jgi:hypothetical protein
MLLKDRIHDYHISITIDHPDINSKLPEIRYNKNIKSDEISVKKK